MRSYYLIIFCFFQSISGEGSHPVQEHFNQLKDSLDAHHKKIEQKTLKRTISKKLMSDVPFQQGYDYLITWNEWHELGIADYIAMFNRTHTAFGTWGLEQLSKPITDIKVLHARQEGIARLDKEPELRYLFCRLLSEIQDDEDALLAYYDEHDGLSQKAKQLYYSYFQSILNNSKVALDYAYVADVGTAVSNLASLLCLNGLAVEFLQAQVEGRQVHILDGIYKGFTNIITSHSPYDTQYQRYKKEQKFDVAPIAYYEGQSSYTGMLGYFGRMLDKVQHTASSLLARGTNPASFEMMTRGSLGDKWSYNTEQNGWPSSIALLWVVGQVAYQDHSLYLRLKQSYERLLFLYNTHVALQHRLVVVADLCSHIGELIEVAQQIPALREHSAIKHAYNLLYEPEYRTKINELFEQLGCSTYAEKKKLFYSRGQVLVTHTLLNEIKMDLVPLLQVVGIIDGYISICRIYQEQRYDVDRPFCFAEYTVGAHPVCCLEDGWLPLIAQEHVYNSCQFGQAHVQNVLLTGPNGGGKSSFLKLIGGSVALAQSWGIVPARSCTMSWFDGLRTSFNPQEDIKRGISTFMAQKEQLDKLKKHVTTHAAGTCCMVLIDEPYRGTIEAEAEKRAYMLAKELAQDPHCMVVMASHLQKPLTLEQETSAYKNMHFHIAEHADGTFTRTFKLIDGAAEWWFQDIDKRMRFIDWLHTHHIEECS